MMTNLLRRNPWLWIVFAFLLLIAAWSVLITIAVNHQPEKIPVGAKDAGEVAVEKTE
jgi:hypothetical protein